VAATLIELMHTASLVHDDVIDEAYHRRGEFSANALFRGKKSVLIGDFILARMMKIMSSEAGPELLAATSRVVEQLCEGELLQMEHVEMLSNDRESYERIIRCKTGVLLGLCSEAGALSVGANAEQCNTMRQFGEQLGIAFQIKDDLLDYSKTEITGKFSCNDIIEQKITLPMIYLLNNCDSSERRKVLRMLSRVKRNPENAQILRQMVEESGGLNYATECMCEIRDKALTLLDSYPQSTVKDALIGFSDFILTRDK
jgi:octaprenyl-diphosphate synthase